MEKWVECVPKFSHCPQLSSKAGTLGFLFTHIHPNLGSEAAIQTPG